MGVASGGGCRCGAEHTAWGALLGSVARHLWGVQESAQSRERMRAGRRAHGQGSTKGKWRLCCGAHAARIPQTRCFVPRCPITWQHTAPSLHPPHRCSPTQQPQWRAPRACSSSRRWTCGARATWMRSAGCWRRRWPRCARATAGGAARQPAAHQPPHQRPRCCRAAGGRGPGAERGGAPWRRGERRRPPPHRRPSPLAHVVAGGAACWQLPRAGSPAHSLIHRQC